MLVFVATTGVVQHVLHRAGFPTAANVTYVIHMMGVVPMLVVEVPFSKWSHLAYRPLAMYFARLQAEALAAQRQAARAGVETAAGDVIGEEPAMAEERIGVFVCNCGTNIAKVVDAARGGAGGHATPRA